MDVKKKKVFFHPILIGIYPFLALLAENLGQIRLQTTLRAGIIALASCTLLYLLLCLLLRNASKAALLSSLWLILFYSYGHIYPLLAGKSLLGKVYGRHLVLIVVWLVLILLGSWLILKKIKEPLPWNRILNVVSLFLLLFSLFQIGSFSVRQQQSATRATNDSTQPSISPGLADAAGPDIYYIVLDGYSRADVIQELYGLDTSPFLDELKRIGFVILDCAQSNYGFTGFAMMSTLNMDYVDSFAKNLPFGSDDRVSAHMEQIRNSIVHSQVRNDLSQQGYKMVAFEIDWPFLEIDDADYSIRSTDSTRNNSITSNKVSKFEDLFLRTTMLRFLMDKNSGFFRTWTEQVKSPRERKFDRVKFKLDELSKIPSIPGKKFVYFHTAMPHAPYVFDANGNYVSNEMIGDIPGYTDQVTYLNKRVLQIVRSLIANSKTQPIIILQGDHGWDPRPNYRMKILSAFYLPDGGDKLLYPTITPVNTFRLIMDYYFGKELGFLKDVSYYSLSEHVPDSGIYATPFKLTPVPTECPSSPL